MIYRDFYSIFMLKYLKIHKISKLVLAVPMHPSSSSPHNNPIVARVHVKTRTLALGQHIGINT